MPDLNDLDLFDEGLPAMNPVPAAEIRRRGDRLRRRHTALLAGGAAVAVALAVGTPVLALRGGADHPVQPAPAPSPSPLTRIPGGFPVATGFPERLPSGEPVRLDTTTADAVVLVCARDALPEDGLTDHAQLNYVGESEDRANRALLVYADARAARDALGAVRSAVEGCAGAPLGNGSSVVETVLQLQLGGDEGFARSEEVTEPDGLVTGATVTELVRVGNALLVESTYGSAGGKQVVATEAARVRTRTATTVAAMCVFSAEGC